MIRPASEETDSRGRATAQVWEAETGADVLVLREVLALAESDPQVAGTVLAALYERRGDEELSIILSRAEEAPLGPLSGEVLA